MDGLRWTGCGHDPGQVPLDLAVKVVDGSEAIAAAIAALADQPDLHGAVASPATAWRVLAGVDAGRLGDLRLARAMARERAWMARAEQTGRCCRRAAREQHCRGPHRRARPGARVTARGRAGRILVRTDGAGFSRGFLDHVAAQRDGPALEYSVGYAVSQDVRQAIALLPEWAWVEAIDAAGGLRDGAQVAGVTDILVKVRHLTTALRRRERVKKAQDSGQEIRSHDTHRRLTFPSPLIIPAGAGMIGDCRRGYLRVGSTVNLDVDAVTLDDRRVPFPFTP